MFLVNRYVRSFHPYLLFHKRNFYTGRITELVGMLQMGGTQDRQIHRYSLTKTILKLIIIFLFIIM